MKFYYFYCHDFISSYCAIFHFLESNNNNIDFESWKEENRNIEYAKANQSIFDSAKLTEMGKIIYQIMEARILVQIDY